MTDVLSLTRAARLAELQKKIKRGEMISHDGMVTVENLLACYPDAQLEDTAEARRIAQIKERAFGKRAESLHKQIANIVSGDADLLQSDIYLAGPEDAVSVAERFFLDKGLPKTRVAVASVK
jgi:CDP-4-dehydro-6-deoxyglucose reductase